MGQLVLILILSSLVAWATLNLKQSEFPNSKDVSVTTSPKVRGNLLEDEENYTPKLQHRCQWLLKYLALLEELSGLAAKSLDLALWPSHPADSSSYGTRKRSNTARVAADVRKDPFLNSQIS